MRSSTLMKTELYGNLNNEKSLPLRPRMFTRTNFARLVVPSQPVGGCGSVRCGPTVPQGRTGRVIIDRWTSPVRRKNSFSIARVSRGSALFSFHVAALLSQCNCHIELCGQYCPLKCRHHRHTGLPPSQPETGLRSCTVLCGDHA